MKNTINNRINQVTEDTLVVGVDIAKKLHYACAVDERGRVLKKSFSFAQSLDGFHQFHQELLSLMNTFQKSKIIVGFEPTGHYWMNLAAFLVDHDIRFVMVNPMHVNKSKELDDNLQTKNDQKDARVIASLLRDGRFSYPRVLEGIEAELRSGTSFRARHQEELTSIKNQMNRWLDIYFPEFMHVFKSFGKHACTVLQITPSPADLCEMGEEDLLTLCKQLPDMRSFPLKKVEKLRALAQKSVGVREGLAMARKHIRSLVKRHQELTEEIALISADLEAFASQLTDYEYIVSIPGVGENTAVELLSEIGALHKYENPRQLIKLAGLTLRENSSGQHKGQKKLSKRGRKRLRAVLFRVILPTVQHNAAFKKLYEYYITRPKNPLRKKQALVALCGKLLKIIHALCTKKVPFNADHMTKDLHCLSVAA